MGSPELVQDLENRRVGGLRDRDSCCDRQVFGGGDLLFTVAGGIETTVDRACAAGVSTDAFEPVPKNSPENEFMPSASDLATYKSEAATGEGGAPGSYLLRVDGKFPAPPTRFSSGLHGKWGFDENVTRATAVNETHWRQTEIGDIGNGTSLGILQIKSSDYPSTCKSVASSQNTADVTNPDCYSYLSTAFAADYKLAQQRACFEGKIGYLASDTLSYGHPAYPEGTPEEMMWDVSDGGTRGIGSIRGRWTT